MMTLCKSRLASIRGRGGWPFVGICLAVLTFPPLIRAQNTFPAAGNVGIGTTSPGNLLEIANSGATTPGIIINNGTGRYEIGVSAGNDGKFGIYDFSAHSNRLVIDAGGNVGIGTTNPAYPLSVNGTIEAKEVIVQSGWSDYVFDRRYKLAPLSEVENAIKAEHHLPGMPSASEVAAKGVDLGAMQAKLLAQVEELTLRLIAQQKQLQAATARIDQLEKDAAAQRDKPL